MIQQTTNLFNIESSLTVGEGGISEVISIYHTKINTLKIIKTTILMTINIFLNVFFNSYCFIQITLYSNYLTVI